MLHLSVFIGKIGITLNCDAAVPKDPSNTLDVEAADRRLQFYLGWFAHPIFGNGEYPDVMRAQVDEKSTNGTRLPRFTEEEKRMVKGKGYENT